ncbi:putative methyl transferase protein [Botrytis fragariae]|uniref:Putative methyl transferase protein n=1 Tax=Botrytis fragariae TaxID=1964551 RepID=A0A8H6EFS8_9HELO|nr:putative methyl transferase protein [Botrytis fragariae]KAF5870315.1 putative methyl transferase protein [Botrytis fragariae]
MAQNIYDQEDFFKAYAQLPRSVHGLEKAPGFEVLPFWLASLEGSNFLDLGCGFGWMCRWARENGAKFVRARARKYPEDPSISYRKADFETLQISPNELHVAYSSLALLYIENLPSLIEQVYTSLKPGGAFIFSVEHPIWTAPRNPDWIKDAEGQDVWPPDSYLFEGLERQTGWQKG